MRLVVVFLTVGIAFSGCLQQRDKNGKILDTPTAGKISVAIDESLKPLLEAELDTFHGAYTYAKINARFVSEAEAMNLLLMDSVRVAVVTRKLNKEEMSVFDQVKIIPDQIKVARDGIAVILNRSNRDSIFQFSQFQDIVSGKVSSWKQINKKSNLENIEVILDNPTSGIVRFLKDSVQQYEKLPSNFYGVNSNQAVIDYVAKKPNAIGLIGACWISDRDDITVNKFLSTIRVARIGKKDKPVQPYQAYVADGKYPLLRDVYMISREARMGLGSGFIAFVAGDKGQRIVLKSGMVPATMPVRLVEIHRNE
jgi:phosphate transport system substrate-binding protein